MFGSRAKICEEVARSNFVVSFLSPVAYCFDAGTNTGLNAAIDLLKQARRRFASARFLEGISAIGRNSVITGNNQSSVLVVTPLDSAQKAS